MKTTEELIIDEIDRRTSEFLKEPEQDVSKKIADYICSIDMTTQELITTPILAKLREIEGIMIDYYTNTDNMYNHKYADVVALERVGKALGMKHFS